MEQKEFKVGGRGAWGVFTVLTLLYLINRADLAICIKTADCMPVFIALSSQSKRG